MGVFRWILSPQPIHRDVGLLVLRVGVGLSVLLFHGWGKITAGPELWARIGTSMDGLGLAFAPTMWGFLAACAESAGSALLALGVLFRPAALALMITMFVAVSHHLGIPAGERGAGWSGASHALELLVVYSGLFLTGPGRFHVRFRPDKKSSSPDGAPER